MFRCRAMHRAVQSAFDPSGSSQSRARNTLGVSRHYVHECLSIAHDWNADRPPSVPSPIGREPLAAKHQHHGILFAALGVPCLNGKNQKLSHARRTDYFFAETGRSHIAVKCQPPECLTAPSSAQFENSAVAGDLTASHHCGQNTASHSTYRASIRSRRFLEDNGRTGSINDRISGDSRSA